jgi:hypothetical protein
MNQNMTRNRLIARYRYFYDYVFQDFGDPATPCSFCCKKTHPICLEHAKSSSVWVDFQVQQKAAPHPQRGA